MGLREPGFAGGAAPARDQSILQALREAFKYPSFQLLMAGYFVCGFQVVFIGVHMPSYLKDKGLSPMVASYALALIGLFNVFGTYMSPASLGQRLAKRKILAFIYLARAVAIAVFLVVPLSPLSVYVFASVMGCCGCPPCRPPTPPWRRFLAWRTCPCWAASCSSATRSARSWACGWAATCTTAPAATTSSGTSPLRWGFLRRW
jgi:predicted MFS family arabinose efflux permease